MNYEVRSHVAFFMEPVCLCLDLSYFKKKRRRKENGCLPTSKSHFKI